MPNRFLESIRLVLESARRGEFRVALIGGFALPFHGVRRATGDVDFLVEGAGGEALDADLLAARFRCLHRSQNAAHYAAPRRDLSSIDAVYARRPASLAMLDRAPERPIASADFPVAVVDVEGIIGLKVQAIANDPKRRRRDVDDIVALLERSLPTVDLALLREYFALFEMGDELEEILSEVRARRR